MKNTITINTKKEVVEDKEITLPAFFKHNSCGHYIGIYDQRVVVYLQDGMLSKGIEVRYKVISQDFSQMVEITEEEFNQARADIEAKLNELIHNATVQNIG